MAREQYHIICTTLTGSVEMNTYTTPKGNEYRFFKRNPVPVTDPEDALYFLSCGPKDNRYFELAPGQEKGVLAKIKAAVQKVAKATPATGDSPSGTVEEAPFDPGEHYGLTQGEYTEASEDGTWDEVEGFRVKKDFDEYAEETWDIELDRRSTLADMRQEFWDAWVNLDAEEVPPEDDTDTDTPEEGDEEQD